MKRVKLSLDDLRVESFVTTPEMSGRGMVEAQCYFQSTEQNLTYLGCGLNSDNICHSLMNCPTRVADTCTGPNETDMIAGCGYSQGGGCNGGANTEYCVSWGYTCAAGTTTCCANESHEGWESCGTTCQDETYCGGAPCGQGATFTCPGGGTAGETCGGATCEGTCDGMCTAPGYQC